MSQKLTVNDFKWVEETSQFNKFFIKNYNDDSNEHCTKNEVFHYGFLQKM